MSRIEWLETLPGLDPAARPRREVHEHGYERWDGNGALGYLALAAIVETTLMNRPRYARSIVARRTFPTGMLGYWVRRLAERRARRRADGDVAAPARHPGRRAEADRDEPARDRDPVAATAARSSPTSRWGR